MIAAALVCFLKDGSVLNVGAYLRETVQRVRRILRLRDETCFL